MLHDSQQRRRLQALTMTAGGCPPCPSVCAQDNPLDKIIVSLICVAIAIPCKIFIERVFVLSNSASAHRALQTPMLPASSAAAECMCAGG